MSNPKSRATMRENIADAIAKRPEDPMVFVRLEIERLPDGSGDVVISPHLNMLNMSPYDLLAAADALLGQAREVLAKSKHPNCENCVQLRQIAERGIAALAFETVPEDGIGEPRGTA